MSTSFLFTKQPVYEKFKTAIRNAKKNGIQWENAKEFSRLSKSLSNKNKRANTSKKDDEAFSLDMSPTAKKLGIFRAAFGEFDFQVILHLAARTL